MDIRFEGELTLIANGYELDAIKINETHEKNQAPAKHQMNWTAMEKKSVRHFIKNFQKYSQFMPNFGKIMYWSLPLKPRRCLVQLVPIKWMPKM